MTWMNLGTEYWKSQDRKYCDFCKCWLTDNKPSIQFHENGKRHKENVAKKISELTKKSTKAQKECQKIDEEMKKMEEAALKAYMKDMESNPDFTSQQYKQKLEERAAAQHEEIKELVKKVVEQTKEPPPSQKPSPSQPKWLEAKSEQGYSYYWNMDTNESVWEAPAEGFVSLEDQEREAAESVKAKEREEEAARRVAAEKAEELRAWQAREDMKKYRGKEAEVFEELSAGSEVASIGPLPRAPDPYGGWTAVQRVEPTKINWQLPESQKIEAPQVVIREPQIKIKEKKMTTTLDDHDSNSAPVFKKRKPNPGRLNMRQRLEDD